jgi:hypothetical protein
MFVDTQVIEFIGVLAGVIAAIVAVLNLENHAFIKFISMMILCTATLALVWLVSRSILLHGAITDPGQILLQARRDAARDEAKREMQAQADAEQRRKDAEKAALADAQKAILGTWKSNFDGSMTFNSDGTVSTFIPSIYTYKLIDSTHLTITGLYGFGVENDYEVQLTGSDQYLKWYGFTWHHASP